MADFSYKRPILTEIAKECAHLTLLDHHASAQEDLEGFEEEHSNVEVVFDMERSGAGITWDFCHPHEPRPRLVDYIEDRDIWRFKYPETKAFQAGIARLDMTHENWDYAAANVDEIVQKGTSIVEYINATVRSIGKRVSKKRMPTYPDGTPGDEVLIVNVPIELSSETGNYLLQTYPKVCVIGWSGSDRGFYCSTRSVDEGPAAKDIAVKMGGGGHRNAAGFSVDMCPTTWETLEEFSYEKEEA